MAIIGYTTGVFDLFHVGHLNILQRAKSQCDHLIVGVTTDELALARKGQQPVIPLAERMEIVAGIRYVDEVVPQADMDKYRAWELFRFDRIFVGDDWKGHPRWIELEERLGRHGVEVIYFPYTRHTSTSHLRELIPNREADSDTSRVVSVGMVS